MDFIQLDDFSKEEIENFIPPIENLFATVGSIHEYDILKVQLSKATLNYSHPEYWNRICSGMLDFLIQRGPVKYLHPKHKVFKEVFLKHPKYIAEVLNLKKYEETMYISKNKSLKEIMDHIYDNDPDGTLFGMIHDNNWMAVNDYILQHPGIKNFNLIFANLFVFYYLDKTISRKEYQICLGIQQVRWMVDTENTCNKPKHELSPICYVWESIPDNEKDTIVETLMLKLKGQLYKSKTVLDLKTLLTNTVWFEHENIDGMWHGFGTQKQFFPVPETLNFSSIACIYAPVIVFGTVTAVTLMTHVVKFKKRPYASHFPNSLGNLCEVHGRVVTITSNWTHDFSHSSGKVCSDNRLIQFLNGWLKTPINEFNIEEMLNDETSELYSVLYKNTGRLIGEKIALAINDSSMYIGKEVPIIAGKRKSKKYKSKKYKSKKYLRK